MSSEAANGEGARVRDVVRSATHIFADRGRDIAGPTVGAVIGVVIAYSVVGIPVGPWMLGMATFASIGTTSIRPEQLKVGAVAALAGLPGAVACWIGRRIMHTTPWEQSPWVAALVIAIAVVGTAALTPLVGTAASLARCGGSIRDAFARSLLRCAQLGPASPILGAMHGAVLVAPFVLTVLAFATLVTDGRVPLFTYFPIVAIGGSSIVAGGAFALSIGAALGEPVLDGTSRVRVRSMIAMPVLALVVTAAVALAVPAPMWSPVSIRPSRRAEAPSFEVREHRDEVDVLLDEEMVATVRFPSGHYVDWPDGVWPLRTGRHDGHFTVATWGPDPTVLLGATFDDEGRRLDDEPLDRLRARFDLTAFVFVALAVVLAGMAALRGRRADRVRASGPIVIDAIVRDGATRLESTDGATVLSFDRSLPSLCAKPPVDGMRVRVVLPRLVQLGPRQGAAAAPPGSWMVDAGVDPQSAVALETARDVGPTVLLATVATLIAGSCALLLL